MNKKYHNPSPEEVEGHRKVIVDTDQAIAELRDQLTPLENRRAKIETEMTTP